MWLGLKELRRSWNITQKQNKIFDFIENMIDSDTNAN